MCRPFNKFQTEWFMEDELLSKLKEEILCKAKVVDLRGWGESTLDTRIIDLARFLRNNNVKTIIYTNLNTQNPRFWKEFAGAGVEIAISIETANEAHYSEIRRGGQLGYMRKNLRAIMEACSDDNTLLRPFFNVVVSESTLRELKGLVEFASQEKIERIELNPISIANGEGHDIIGFTKEITSEERVFFRELLNESERKNVRIEIAANLYNENNALRRTCSHPWDYLCIGSNGDIIFCDHLIHNENGVVGNLANGSFWEIWNGKLYKTIRKCHYYTDFGYLNTKGLECEWCYLNRYGNKEYLVGGSGRPIALSEYMKINNI